jgi:16S rRNA (guanine966-N2)-methyltransferase
MKDRTREAVMNLLGGTFPGFIAFDLFGGSGVLGFEAISRGATQAIIWEILRPRAADILRFAKELGISDRVTVHAVDVMRWTRDGGFREEDWQKMGETPWILFVCPPYALWETDGASIRDTIATWLEMAPLGSLFAVELELETDETWLPDTISWDVRSYAPAKVAVAEKTSSFPSPQASLI